MAGPAGHPADAGEGTHPKATRTAEQQEEINLHGRLLAIVLGVAGKESTGPLTVEEGERITSVIRKGR
jgi:hypothetical protein